MTFLFNDEDRKAYLLWLKEYSEKSGVEVFAYCLMTNHAHLVAVPIVMIMFLPNFAKKFNLALCQR